MTREHRRGRRVHSVWRWRMRRPVVDLAELERLGGQQATDQHPSAKKLIRLVLLAHRPSSRASASVTLGAGSSTAGAPRADRRGAAGGLALAHTHHRNESAVVTRRDVESNMIHVAAPGSPEPAPIRSRGTTLCPPPGGGGRTGDTCTCGGTDVTGRAVNRPRPPRRLSARAASGRR